MAEKNAASEEKALCLMVIDQDQAARDVLVQEIGRRFPALAVHPVGSPDEAMCRLRRGSCDIIVCSAHLFREDKISFLTGLCLENDLQPTVIAVTAHADVAVERFPAEVQGECLQHVVYMPVDLEELMEFIEEAIRKAESKKAG